MGFNIHVGKLSLGVELGLIYLEVKISVASKKQH